MTPPVRSLTCNALAHGNGGGACRCCQKGSTGTADGSFATSRIGACVHFIQRVGTRLMHMLIVTRLEWCVVSQI